MPFLADETPSADITSTSNDYATNINTISTGKIYITDVGRWFGLGGRQQYPIQVIQLLLHSRPTYRD